MPVKKNPKTGLWEARVSARHPITKKSKNLHRINFATKPEALRAEKKMWNQLFSKFNEEVHPLWNAVAEEYTEKKRAEGSVSERYLAEKTGTIKKYTGDLWRRRAIDQIRTQEIKDLITIDIHGISESRKKEIYKAIKHVFDYATDAGYVSSNPMPKIGFKLNKKMYPVLVESEIRLLLSEAKKKNHLFYPVYVTALHTGMRNGELYALEWEFVDLERNLIQVRASYDRTYGFKDLTKGGYDRLIELSPPLKKLFIELKAANPDSKFVLPRIPEWTIGRQSAVLREFLGDIGIKSVRFHDLRASWACLLMTKGVPAAQVQMMGGWKDMKTFQIYVRKAGIEIKGATKVLSCLEEDNEDEDFS